MNLTIIALMSLCSVAAFLVMACRVVGVRKVLQYATFIDVIFTVSMCIAMAGTLTGILIGIMAGLVLSVTLSVAKAALARIDNSRFMAAKGVTPAEDWCPGGSPEALSV